MVRPGLIIRVLLFFTYSAITLIVASAGKKTAYDDYSDTMLPEGIETIHPRFAISWRNTWMLKQSHYVVTYITHSWGGAAQFAEKAIRQKKTVINLL